MNVVIYFKNGNTAYFKEIQDYEKDIIAGIAKTKEAKDE